MYENTDEDSIKFAENDLKTGNFSSGGATPDPSRKNV